MPRQVLRQGGTAVGQRWAGTGSGAASGPAFGLAVGIGEWWRHFREGRLFVQVLLSLGLVALSALAAALPAGPLERVRTALAWTATTDYDFRGKAVELQRWAQKQGGWGSALSGLWEAGQARVQGWIDRARPAAQGAEPQERHLRAGPRFQWPVEGAVLYGFGWLPPEVGERFHEGLDILAPLGAEVVAAADGTVTRVAADPHLGELVEVDHGVVTAVYAQVSAVRVQKGNAVKAGQVLAVVGSPVGGEGATEPHLHFEIRPGGGADPVDPAFYLGLGGSKL